MNTMHSLVSVTCLPILALAGLCYAESQPSPANESAGQRKIEFPGIAVFPQERRIHMDARIALQNGIVEFLLVQNGGKDYESLLVSDAKPSHLNLALGLIGLKNAQVDLDEAGMVETVPEAAIDRGGVAIEISWTDARGDHRMRPEDLLVNRANPGAKVSPAPFVLTGSQLRHIPDTGPVFEADYARLHIGLWFTPAAVVNYTVKAKNPYWCEECGFEVHGERAPEPGTKVSILMTPWKNE